MAEEKQPNNIKFIGEGEPFESFNTATATITLPPATEQSKGFYHEDAALIVKTWPHLYKPIIPKGVK